MKLFAVILRVKDKDIAEKFYRSHLDYIKQMCTEGNVLQSGKLVGSGGLIIYQGESVEEIEEFVINDPYIIHGARKYEIFEWNMKTAEEILE